MACLWLHSLWLWLAEAIHDSCVLFPVACTAGPSWKWYTPKIWQIQYKQVLRTKNSFVCFVTSMFYLRLFCKFGRPMSVWQPGTVISAFNNPAVRDYTIYIHCNTIVLDYSVGVNNVQYGCFGEHNPFYIDGRGPATVYGTTQASNRVIGCLVIRADILKELVV